MPSNRLSLPFDPHRRRALGGVAAMLCLGVPLLSACSGEGNETKDTPYEATAMGYVKTPEIKSVAVTAAGDLLVTGTAFGGGRVRLTSATGQAYGVTADADGHFQASLPQMTGGSLYDLSMEERGRLMKAEGRLFVPPSTASDLPPKAAFMRMGASSLPLWPQAPLLALADYDAGGGLAVSGRARPDAIIEIELNGRPAVRAQAESDGVYTALIPLNPEALGQTLTLSARDGATSETRSLNLRTRGEGPNATANENGVWYVYWNLQGGGAQTSIMFAD